MPADSHVSKPNGEIRGGVVVLHAWWGLNSFTRDFCDRLAGEGFLVVAPDLYEGKIAKTIEDAETFSGQLQGDVADREVRGAIEQLKNGNGMEGHQLGVVGFSLGAAFALSAATDPANDVRATVVFYGTYGGLDFSRSRSTFLGHFAENDEFEPASSVEDLQTSLVAAGRDAEFYTYPAAGHWFFESDRSDAYNAEAAALAWERTIAFLRSHLS